MTALPTKFHLMFLAWNSGFAIPRFQLKFPNCFIYFALLQTMLFSQVGSHWPWMAHMLFHCVYLLVEPHSENMPDFPLSNASLFFRKNFRSHLLHNAFPIFFSLLWTHTTTGFCPEFQHFWLQICSWQFSPSMGFGPQGRVQKGRNPHDLAPLDILGALPLTCYAPTIKLDSWNINAIPDWMCLFMLLSRHSAILPTV